jgi:hypothetical protein
MIVGVCPPKDIFAPRKLLALLLHNASRLQYDRGIELLVNGRDSVGV